jgi:membrane protease YdiL (CAAX protease family)
MEPADEVGRLHVASSLFRRHPLVSFFGVAYTVTWAIWAPILAQVQGWATWDVPYALYYFGSFGPAIAGLLVTGLTSGPSGVRALLGRIAKWRVELRYYAFAVLAPVGLFVSAVLVDRVASGTWPDLALLGRADYLSDPGPAAVLGLWLLTYGLGEEAGWRGFALPHLQRSRGAESASLTLGVLWAFWHLPAFFFRDTYMAMGVFGFPLFVVLMVFTSMVFTWLYNSTRGSLLLVILFHAVFNWLSVSEAGGQFGAPFMSAPMVLWALYVVRRHGPENAAPFARQTQ